MNAVDALDEIAPELTIEGIGKTFGTTTVLHNINLTIRGGEFVGLMGPNGAGKSTLIKILDGVYTPSTGRLKLDGNEVSALGDRPEVSFIHQDLGLVDELPILDNMRLGATPMRRVGPILDRTAEREWAERALEHVGLHASVDTLVGELSPGEKTEVAVARAFARGARIIFVDESTSTLPPREAQRVIDSLTRVTSGGATVVMVSHKLSEILGATSRVVVLLDGHLAADQSTEGMDRSQLVGMLLQHETDRADRDTGAGGHEHPSSGEQLVELKGVSGGRAGPLDLTLARGEVIGISGMPGSGLHDVAFLIHGSMRPTAGKLDRRKGLRVALVPPHRETQGGFPELEVLQNLTVSALSRWTKLARMLLLRREASDSQDMIERLNVQPQRLDAAYGVLSGGNKQKVVFGRALFQQPDLYVLCEPTRGVDVGTRSELYGLIRGLREEGAGVLVVSSDLEDLLAVCDRIAIITDGQLTALQPVSAMDQDALEALV